jgi:hypothetical protein
MTDATEAAVTRRVLEPSESPEPAGASEQAKTPGSPETVEFVVCE